MKQEEKEEELQDALFLMEAFRKVILKEDINDLRYQWILDMAAGSIQNVMKERNVPKHEAKELYDNVCRMCFTYKFKLSKEESKALTRLRNFANCKSIWEAVNNIGSPVAGFWGGKQY